MLLSYCKHHLVFLICHSFFKWYRTHCMGTKHAHMLPYFCGTVEHFHACGPGSLSLINGPSELEGERDRKVWERQWQTAHPSWEKEDSLISCLGDA